MHITEIRKYSVSDPKPFNIVLVFSINIPLTLIKVFDTNANKKYDNTVIIAELNWTLFFKISLCN